MNFYTHLLNNQPKSHCGLVLLHRRRISSSFLRFTQLFRLRYVLFGAGVGGTYAVSKKYDEIKSSLPDLTFLQEYVPKSITLRENLGEFKDRISSMNESRRAYFHNLKVRFNEKFLSNSSLQSDNDNNSSTASAHPKSGTDNPSEKIPKPSKKHVTVEELQEAIFKNEMAFHKRIENLLQENRELRSELLLRSHKPSQKGRINKSLIDMYSEVLDELSDLDSAYNVQDQLPRVVVVGDQSAGKTSVLEMIAQARIFPRGSGEMMTRSPVKVTLSEGPYHVASFKDSPREYDLTKDSELAALRKDIEMRMKALVSGGKTISSEVISLNVKGPGLQRMVLVDLPGIISTVTKGMQSNTRETIQEMAKHYMSNPNAIILCIQDGSIDAERSNVTDLVSSVDPLGRRTIFVLTKVDLAEATLFNPNRIKQILEGKLFPMKALGYFAVVTGKGTKDESIDSIKEYEEEFFRHSRLFREGALRLSQMTTANLSKAVSERFWKMVKDSVEQQADTYRAIRYNLETQWKNSFPHIREMDREELFEKARNEILDDLVSLNGINATVWEKNLRMELWNQLNEPIFSEIFEPAQHIQNLGAFQTSIDIWLRDWVENKLPRLSINAGWQTLYSQLDNKLKQMSSSPGHDTIFDHLKNTVHQETRNRHHWDPKAESRLRVIQSTALDDRTVHTKAQWTEAVDFLEHALKGRLKLVNQSIAKMCGPNWTDRWLHWKSRSHEEQLHLEAVKEIEVLLTSISKPATTITPDDLTTVRRNLQARSIDVNDHVIRETWEPLVKRLYLEQALFNCHECRKSFYYYQQGFLNSSAPRTPSNTRPSLVNQVGINDVTPIESNAEDSNLSDSRIGLSEHLDTIESDFSDCRDVIFFARLIRMLDATSNALRQQIMNEEARRLEYHVKQVLYEISNDPIRLRKLIMGRRVQLAEDLKRTRHLQEKLEEFITALNKEAN